MATPTQSGNATDGREAVAIPGTWTRDIGTEGGAYRLFLWAPPGPAPAAGHPVTYLLDGNAVFGTAVDIARLRAEGFGPAASDPGAIVAIGYPGARPIEPSRRTLDLTPGAASRAAPEGADGTPHPPPGGADRFLDVIEREVKPLVAGEIPVDPRRETLFGHSFGGLFALHCLFTRPRAFSTYVAASPSIWWNAGSLLAAEEAFRNGGGAARPTRLLLTAGSEEQPSANDTADDRHTRRRRAARIVDHARDMAARLQTVPRLSTRFHIFEGETHGSVIPAAVARALGFATEPARGARA